MDACGSVFITGQCDPALHLGKFSSCQDVALWTLALDESTVTGDSDFDGYFTLLQLESPERWEISPGIVVHIPAADYLVHTASSGLVSVSSSSNGDNVARSFQLASAAYEAWSSADWCEDCTDVHCDVHALMTDDPGAALELLEIPAETSFPRPVASFSQHYLGRTADGTRVYVEITLSKGTGESFTNTEHETVKGAPWRLSIMGCGVSKGARSVSSAGQIRDELLLITEPAKGWTRPDIRELSQLWEGWHLNDTRAACAHQLASETVWEDGRYGRQIDLVNTPACPVTGYRYGSAWLVDELPATVLQRITRFQSMPTGSIPSYL